MVKAPAKRVKGLVNTVKNIIQKFTRIKIKAQKSSLFFNLKRPATVRLAHKDRVKPM